MTRTILVADEDVDTRIILRALLERHGYAVVEAATAEEAVRACDQDLCLIILNHPISLNENVTLASWLRTEAKTQPVPIINLTSRAIPLFIEEASQLGVKVTLAKPIDVHRMLQLVEELTGPLVAH